MEMKAEKKGIKSHYNVDDEMSEMIFLPRFLMMCHFSLYEKFLLFKAKKPFFLFIFAFNVFCLRHVLKFFCVGWKSLS